MKWNEDTHDCTHITWDYTKDLHSRMKSYSRRTPVNVGLIISDKQLSMSNTEIVIVERFQDSGLANKDIPSESLFH